MQTNILPIQVSGAAPANAPQRQNSGADSDQFGATLARQIEQRQPQHATQPAPQAQPAKAQQPQDGAQPDQTQSEAQSQDDARPAATAQASKPQAADGAQDKDKAEDKDTSDAKAQPATDMLALIAGFSQLRQASSATAATARPGVPAAAAGVSAGKGQAALQAALKGLGKDDAGAAQADTRAQAGDALPAGAQHGTADGIDLRAAQAIAGFKAHGAAGDAALPNFAARLDAARLAPTAAPLAAPPQLQVAALQAAAPAAAAAANSIGARVGTPDWENQMGQKIVWMAAGGEQSASLTLNPPDLGPLQVVLSVTGDQASVAFSASQQDVRHALESSLPRLREMMSESGIALGSATVSAGMPDQRQAQGGSGGGSAKRGGQAMADSVAGVDSAPAAAVRTTMLGDGMVDTFV
jgi:flagellar hook-length control protein FliK